MFGDPESEREAIEATYTDTATIKHRIVPVKGYIKEPAEIIVCQDEPCALSYLGDSSNQTYAQHNIDYDAELFIRMELMIQPGDKVIVNRLKKAEFTFEVIGWPKLYSTHQEVKLRESDLA